MFDLVKHNLMVYMFSDKQNGTSFCVVSSPLCLIVDHRENSLYRENSLDIFPVS